MKKIPFNILAKDEKRTYLELSKASTPINTKRQIDIQEKLGEELGKWLYHHITYYAWNGLNKMIRKLDEEL